MKPCVKNTNVKNVLYMPFLDFATARFYPNRIRGPIYYVLSFLLHIVIFYPQQASSKAKVLFRLAFLKVLLEFYFQPHQEIKF